MKQLGGLLVGVALAACGDDDVDIITPPAPDATVETVARDFTFRIENVAPWTVLKAGAQTFKTDLIEGPAAPGEAFEIRFTANTGHNVSFVTMLGESNDWFFGPGPDGIPLFNHGVPVSGDVTAFVKLWDAGTEFDQEPAVGDATGTLQRLNNFGEPDPQTAIAEVPVNARLDDNSIFVRPAVSSMIRATLTPAPDQIFVLRIENVSNANTLVTSLGPRPIHLSPVAFAIHRSPGPIFTVGQPARENGLEILAESGGPYPLSSALSFSRGAATGLSPGVFAIHRTRAPLFDLGAPDPGAGLERLAEDGNAVPLRDALASRTDLVASGMFDTPIGLAPGPAMPGHAFETVFRAEPGDALSFATMFGMSNDWFFAPGPEGIPLFDGDVPRSCDVTSEVKLFDLGTEVDEELDVGPNTAPQQPAPDTGPADRIDEVRKVTIERYGEPEVLHLRVTLRPSIPVD